MFNKECMQTAREGWEWKIFNFAHFQNTHCTFASVATQWIAVVFHNCSPDNVVIGEIFGMLCWQLRERTKINFLNFFPTIFHRDRDAFTEKTFRTFLARLSLVVWITSREITQKQSWRCQKSWCSIGLISLRPGKEKGVERSEKFDY